MRIDHELLAQIAKEDPQYAAKVAKDYRRAMITLARKDPSYFCAYVLRNERDGSQIHQHPNHELIHKTILANPRTAIWTHPGFGKALPITTPIPTPSGWKTMGELSAGEEVFSSSGEVCEVLCTTDIQQGRDVYEVTFDDGTTMRADGEHLWSAKNVTDRHQHRAPRVVTTVQMLHSLVLGGKKNWSIALPGAAQYPERSLPVHPYVLGAWLGDGNSAMPMLTFHKDDRYIFDRCQELEGGVHKPRPIKDRPDCMRGTFGGPGFIKKLKDLGVVGRSGSKFIPTAYLLGSVAQRMELLAGLLDTDGSPVTQNGRPIGTVELSFCLEPLALGALELIRSLGFKARYKPQPSTLNGKVVGVRHRIWFMAPMPVFRLQRKLDKQRLGTGRGVATVRYVVSIKPVLTEPVRCIRVSSPDHTFLASKDYVVTHNCEVAGTPVLLADGTWVPIESLKEWAPVLTWDGISPQLKTVTARSTFNGKKPTLKLGLEDGRTMEVTTNHPLMPLSMHWTPADQLKVGDALVCLRSLEPPESVLTTPEDIPEDEAEILGYLLAGRALRTGSVQVRTIKSSPKWTQRRDKLFTAAGWMRIPVTRVDGSAVSWGQQKGAMPPATFLKLWATVDRDGWPIEVHPAVYRLPKRAIQKLLSAFFSAAFMELPNKRRRGLAGTVGLGTDRAPHMVGHVRKETLLMIQRLLLRVGATSKIGRLRDLASISLVTFKQLVGKKLSSAKPWKITLDHGEFRHFWPSNEAAPVAPLVRSVRIESIELNETPIGTWAVEVLEKEHSYFSQGVLSHNTNQISIGHVLWRIGNDPNCAIAIMTNTGGLATRIITTLKTYISESLEFRDVFPHVQPGDKWSETAFTVTRDTIRKDPTVQAVGLTGSIVGSRLEGLIIDDIDDIDSTHTQEARNGTEAKVRKQALTRLDADSWAIAIGNVWHEDDCMHRLAKTNWKTLEFPVMVPDGEGGWESRDPEFFPMDRIHLIRDEDVGPVEFERLYMLRARIDGEQRFKPEWIDTALQKGKGLCLCSEGLPSIPSGCRTITGVDLGVKQKASSDPTAIITILEMPQGGKRVEYQVLNIVKGRWNAEEIMNNVSRQQRLFGSEVWVESNGAQDFLIQLLNMNGSGIKVGAFWTGKNKYDPAYGVESIAAEMATGCWWIPSFEGTQDSLETEVDQLVQEMLAYTPGNHTGDLLMALWIARESARTSRIASKGVIEYGRLRLRR